MTLISQDIQGKLKRIIADRCGLYFKDHALRSLDNAVMQRMKDLHMDSSTGYLSHLVSPQTRDNELRELLNILTINHTYFFRNSPQFKVLREKILPEIMRRKLSDKLSKGNNSEKCNIRVWSAGCSSGEEPYSIAILLKELIPDRHNWNIHILATDASRDALTSARQGIYSGLSIKNMDKRYLDRHFTPRAGSENGPCYAINDDIKKMVSFGFFNLIDQEYPGGFDIIFCRNVTIYFKLKTTIEVMSKFHRALDDKGYLFIGYSEHLQFLRDKYKMAVWEDAVFYRKNTGDGAADIAPAFYHDIKEEKADLNKVLEEISRAQIRLAEKKESIPTGDKGRMLVEIIKAIHLKEYDHAMSLIKNIMDIDKKDLYPRFLAADILANQGKVDEARKELNGIIGGNTMFAPAYYLLGGISMEEGDLERAKENLRKALYADKDFLMANFYLAQTFKEEGNDTYAIREYRNTLGSLSTSKMEAIIPYSGGITVATLRSLCIDNIERIKLQENENTHI